VVEVNMEIFESYSFSRLYLDKNLEFFFILGVNDSDNFIDVWDGRYIEVIGYIVIYMNHEKEQENYIYLIDKTDRNFENIIRYTKQFINQISLSPKLSDRENVKIQKTNVDGKFVRDPLSFMKKVIGNDIPQSIFHNQTPKQKNFTDFEKEETE
jgi:hypothetical protein